MWPDQQAMMPILLSFFLNRPNLQELAKDTNVGEADLGVEVLATNFAQDKPVLLGWDSGRIVLAITGYVPDQSSVRATGKIASLMDIQGASLVMTSIDDRLAALAPIWISIKTKQGQELEIDVAKLEKISVGGLTAYLYEFEKPARPVESDKTSPKK
jgi:hypothetical protein